MMAWLRRWLRPAIALNTPADQRRAERTDEAVRRARLALLRATGEIIREGERHADHSDR